MERSLVRPSTSPVTLSATRRAVFAAMMAFLLVVGRGLSAGAEIEWCKRDPVVRINGTTYNILVSSPNEILESTTGPIAVVIAVPVGTEYSLVSTDEGFGYGEDVRFVEVRAKGVPAGSFGVGVRVPADDALPVVVDVVGPNGTRSVEGQTNAWITLAIGR